MKLPIPFLVALVVSTSIIPTHAETLRDLPYVTRGHDKQKLDIYLPDKVRAANGDGQVTAAEFKAPPALFKRFDKNGDGILTRPEFPSGN